MENIHKHCSICKGAAKDAVLATQKRINEIHNMNNKEFTQLRRRMEGGDIRFTETPY